MVTSTGQECAPSEKPLASPMTLAEFCAEAGRIGLTVDVFAAQLAVRPEFADCLPTRVEQEQLSGRPCRGQFVCLQAPRVRAT